MSEWFRGDLQEFNNYWKFSLALTLNGRSHSSASGPIVRAERTRSLSWSQGADGFQPSHSMRARLKPRSQAQQSVKDLVIGKRGSLLSSERINRSHWNWKKSCTHRLSTLITDPLSNYFDFISHKRSGRDRRATINSLYENLNDWNPIKFDQWDT